MCHFSVVSKQTKFKIISIVDDPLQPRIRGEFRNRCVQLLPECYEQRAKKNEYLLRIFKNEINVPIYLQGKFCSLIQTEPTILSQSVRNQIPLRNSS